MGGEVRLGLVSSTFKIKHSYGGGGRGGVNRADARQTRERRQQPAADNLSHNLQRFRALFGFYHTLLVNDPPRPPPGQKLISQIFRISLWKLKILLHLP